MKAAPKSLDREVIHPNDAKLLLLMALESHFKGDLSDMMHFIKDHYINSGRTSKEEAIIVMETSSDLEAWKIKEEFETMLLEVGECVKFTCVFCNEKNVFHGNTEDTTCIHCNTKN